MLQHDVFSRYCVKAANGALGRSVTELKMVKKKPREVAVNWLTSDVIRWSGLSIRGRLTHGGNHSNCFFHPHRSFSSLQFFMLTTFVTVKES